MSDAPSSNEDENKAQQEALLEGFFKVAPGANPAALAIIATKVAEAMKRREAAGD